MIRPGEHVFISGMTGSGKTTLTRKIADLFQRRIVFDALFEWNDPGFIYVSDFGQFSRAYRELHGLEAFTVIFRPHAGTNEESIREQADAIVALCYHVESAERLGLVLVFEEMWLYAPLFTCPPFIQQTSLTGRHYAISIIANSQRPADVSKKITTQARHIFQGSFYDINDRKFVKENLGLVTESPPPGTFLWFRPSNPKEIQRVSVF